MESNFFTLSSASAIKIKFAWKGRTEAQNIWAKKKQQQQQKQQKERSKTDQDNNKTYGIVDKVISTHL